jgi:hypothetical protein
MPPRPGGGGGGATGSPCAPQAEPAPPEPAVSDAEINQACTRAQEKPSESATQRQRRSSFVLFRQAAGKKAGHVVRLASGGGGQDTENRTRHAMPVQPGLGIVRLECNPAGAPAPFVAEHHSSVDSSRGPFPGALHVTLPPRPPGQTPWVQFVTDQRRRPPGTSPPQCDGTSGECGFVPEVHVRVWGTSLGVPRSKRKHCFPAHRCYMKRWQAFGENGTIDRLGRTGCDATSQLRPQLYPWPLQHPGRHGAGASRAIAQHLLHESRLPASSARRARAEAK